jgi:hypothetical protein
MRAISTTVGAAALTLSYLLSSGCLQAQSFSPGDFVLTLKEEDKLEIGYGSNSITVDAGGAWSSVEGAADNTYEYSGDVKIGKFSIGKVKASVGPGGVKFITAAGFDLGSLSLSAGELTLELMPGDQISGQHDFLTFGKNDFVLYTAISTGLEFGIGSSTSISIPTPGDVSASLAVEVTKGSLYYEGPIPNPALLANGVNKFIGSASGDKDNGNMATGGFGFSVDKSFTYESAFAVFESSEKPPASEKFEANVVMLGEFELAEMATVEGTFMVDVETGRVGVNGTSSIGFEMLGASVGMELGTASFIVDQKGVRLGSQMGSDDVLGLPSELANIAHFLMPALGSGMSASGTFKTGGDFILGMTIDSMNMYGIDMSDSSFSLSPKGLDVDAKFQLDGVGKVKVSGEINKDDCKLTAEKIKIFNFWEMKNASVSFCKMAKEGAYAFAGEIKSLGLSIPVSGIADAADSAASALNKDVKARTGFAVNKKFGVGGSGIAGGYVKLSATGDVDLTLNAASGKLHSDVELDGKAKFCGKVKIKGFNKQQCKTTKSGISQSLDVDAGCFSFDAQKDILGKTFKIDAGKVCPFPAANKDSSDYSDDNLDDGDTLDEDVLGVVIALKDYKGKYVTVDDGLMLRVSNNFTDRSYFSFINKDDKDCPMNGSHLSIQVGDGTDDDERYWTVKKDKYTALNAQSEGTEGGKKGEKRFILEAVKMADKCISDGDTISLKNKEYGRWVRSSDDDPLGATNDSGLDQSVFTVVFTPDEA